jgi:division protein CdvB (Snf7/Vps24/ESCRT-III family)
MIRYSKEELSLRELKKRLLKKIDRLQRARIGANNKIEELQRGRLCEDETRHRAS